jgi:hypothetical protein
MANEFIIKNGFHSKGDSQITGSLIVSGNISASGDITLGHTTNFSGYVAGTTPYMFTNQSYQASGDYSLGFLIATGSDIGGTAVKISGSSAGSFVGIGVPYTTPLTKALTVEGDISASGDVIADNLYIGNGKIYGNEAYNNYLTFNASSSIVKIENKTYVKFDGSNAQREVTINEGTNNIDFVVKGASNNPLFKTDSATNRVGMHGVGTPTAGLHIADNLWVSGSNGHITASGVIKSAGLQTAGTQHTIFTTASVVYSGSNVTQVTQSFGSTQQITNIIYSGSFADGNPLSIAVTGSDGVNKLYTLTYSASLVTQIIQS